MARGKFLKWVSATVNEPLWLGKAGVTFQIWSKRKKAKKKLGTLTVSVGGLRWLSYKGKKEIPVSWDRVRDWFEAE